MYLLFYIHRRMSHSKDASIYTSNSGSGADTNITVMSSAASSVSTEYVSLNSTGASYHTMELGQKQPGSKYNTLEQSASKYNTLDQSGSHYNTMGFSSRGGDSKHKTNDTPDRQFTDPNYHANTLNRDSMGNDLPYGEPEESPLDGSQIDPLMYQINPHRRTEQDVYYCKVDKSYLENIRHNEENTTGYPEPYGLDPHHTGPRQVEPHQVHSPYYDDQFGEHGGTHRLLQSPQNTGYPDTDSCGAPHRHYPGTHTFKEIPPYTCRNTPSPYTYRNTPSNDYV